MTAGLLARTAERHDAAAVLADDVGEHVRGVGGGHALRVKCPDGWQGIAVLVVDFEFAARDDGSRRIEPEGIGVSRRGDGDGIGAEHGLAAEGGDHDGLGIGAGDADEAFVAGHLRIVAGDAEVIAVAHGDHRHAAFLGLLDGEVHGELRDDLAHRGMPLDGCRDGGLEDDLGSFVDVDRALLDALVVAHHALHAMAFDAVEICGEQHVADDGAVLFRKAEGPEDVVAELVQGFVLPVHVGHVLPILSCGYVPYKILHSGRLAQALYELDGVL